MLFFRDQGRGDDLPYITEYLLCEHFHWSWQQLMETPADVIELWRMYRAQQVQAEKAELEARSG